MTKLIAILFFAGLFFSDFESKSTESDNLADFEMPLGQKLQDGDLILREGKGLISSYMRSTSAREKRFSHAGLVLNTTKGPRVFHVIGTPENPDGSIRIESPENFCDSHSNTAYAVVRFPLTTEQKTNLRIAVNSAIKNKVVFDKDFDLLSDDKMYCTEFIYKMLALAASDQQWISISNTPKGNYVGLDDLYLNQTARHLTFKTFKP